MTEHKSSSRGRGLPRDKVIRLTPGFVTCMAMIFVSILGSIAVGSAVIPATASDPIIWASVFYPITTLAGLIALLAGFGILGWVLARRNDEARGWARAAVVLLIALPIVFVIGGLSGGRGWPSASPRTAWARRSDCCGQHRRVRDGRGRTSPCCAARSVSAPSARSGSC